jgi:hypothetical protein
LIPGGRGGKGRGREEGVCGRVVLRWLLLDGMAVDVEVGGGFAGDFGGGGSRDLRVV